MTKPSAAGRTVPIMVRTTESAAAWIDEQRGDRSRAEFIRDVLAEKAGKAPKKTHRPADADEIGAVMAGMLDAAGYDVMRRM